MRQIEAKINNRRRETGRRSDILLTNFRGIELRHFPAEIARLALIIAEYQCDVLYRGQREALAEFLPLDAMNWIVCGNALTLDWMDICPPTGTGVRLTADDLFQTPLDQAEIDFENEGGETYICGNPPYKGGTEQSKSQKRDMQSVFGASFQTWRSFDYILGFFQKARLFLEFCEAQAAFVTTNSVCQGEQVYRYWPQCISSGVKISFAVTSFKWSNLASRNAGVSVCIVGLGRNPRNVRYFDGAEGLVRKVDNINAYLVPQADVYVKASTKPLNGMVPVVNGSKPADGGGLILDSVLAKRLIAAAPSYRHTVRPFFGAHDAIHGISRYCIWASREEYRTLDKIEEFHSRFTMVAEMRKNSRKQLTKLGAERPYEFQQIRQTGQETVFQVPRHSSERRDFYPVIALPKGAIVGDGAFSFYDPPLWCIAIFASRLSLVWIAAVCGKIKNDYRYSNTLGWNTFPVPTITTKNKADLRACAENILLAREAHFPATIAELYDPAKMPGNLRAAHEHNDEVVERIYIGRCFRNDTERLEGLFDMYARMVDGANKVKA